MEVLLLFLIVITFYTIGGSIDYWQAAMEHKKKLPIFLRDFFLVIWLFIYSGTLPFLLVFIASGFDITLAFAFLAAACIGSVGWDVTYSLLDTNKLVSDQKGYFVLKGKNYGLTEKQTFLWHGIRLGCGALFFVWILS